MPNFSSGNTYMLIHFHFQCTSCVYSAIAAVNFRLSLPFRDFDLGTHVPSWPRTRPFTPCLSVVIAAESQRLTARSTCGTTRYLSACT